MNFALPPYLLLIPFVILLAVAVFFSLVNVTHLIRYGARNFVGFIATFLYVSGFAIILFLTWRYMPILAWTEPVSLFGAMTTSF